MSKFNYCLSCVDLVEDIPNIGLFIFKGQLSVIRTSYEYLCGDTGVHRQ